MNRSAISSATASPYSEGAMAPFKISAFAGITLETDIEKWNVIGEQKQNYCGDSGDERNGEIR
jgi:hypothetical protein